MNAPTLPTRIEVEPQPGRPAGGAQPTPAGEGGEAFALVLAGHGEPAGPVAQDAPGAKGVAQGLAQDVTKDMAQDVAQGLALGAPVQAAPLAPEQLDMLPQEIVSLESLPPEALSPAPGEAPPAAAVAAALHGQATELPELLRSAAAADVRTPPGGNGSLSRLLGILQVLYGVAPGTAQATPGEHGAATSTAALMQALGVTETAGDGVAAGRAQVEIASARAAEPGISLLGTAPGPASTSAATSPAGASMPSLPVSVPAGGPDWGEALGQRVLWMVRGKVQTAELRLNPPDLGAVEVRVRLEDDGLRLSFNATTAGAREALEHAAPRLRDALQAEGFSLAGLDIERHGRGEGGQDDAAGAFDGDEGQLVEDGDEALVALPAAAAGRGLVDTFV